MSWTQRSVVELRNRLLPVEEHARTLSWDGPRGWRVRTHVGTERRLWVRRERDERIVCLDLHGLDRPGAAIACERVRALLIEPGSPLRYLRVVVGRGHRSESGRRVLFEVVEQAFRVGSTDPWSVRSSTAQAERGFLDIWHRGRWPRLSEGHATREDVTGDV